MPAKGKRTHQSKAAAPVKRRKVANVKENNAGLKKNGQASDKSKGKEKAFDRKYIPIPVNAESDNEDDVELSDQDVEVLQQASFLKHLDQKGIARSKKETERLHLLNKPVRVERKRHDLPSMDSSDSSSGEEFDGEPMASEESKGEDVEEMTSPEDETHSQAVDSDSDAEMSYEQIPRKRRASWDEQDNLRNKKIKGLPTKLADGTIQRSEKVLVLSDSDYSSGEDSEDEPQPQQPEYRVEDVATGARFGRTAVADVIGNGSRRQRVEAAKEQIANICQAILAEPENNLGLLRRLHTFSLREVTTPSRPNPIPNDPIIRKLTFLSQLAVFKDIIPGYRIRSLTDAEKAEKVSSMVARTREWEQNLVLVYQSYLRSLEAEIKERTELADVALSCMCTLLAEVTHFNFSVNLISCVVARLSKKSWDKSSELCINTIIKVFRADLTGSPSLEIVRTLNRMIKESRFAVHVNALSCLLHLRLRTELGTRASDTRADKEDGQKKEQRKGKKSDQPHISKKGKKFLKEKKEIDKEMREAEAEVDKEERAATQTETLKLLFALYFRILKNPRPTPLLPAALTGISKYAHLVNIDFFRDLLKVLKDLISLDTDEFVDTNATVESVHSRSVKLRLQCITTAFDLLTGQGEALNIDLSDFVNQLYAMILPLTLVNDIEAKDHPTRKALGSAESNVSKQVSTTSEQLFRALNTVFSPKAGGGPTAPPWRSAAFAKRLITASLHWPPSSAQRALDLVHSLMVKNPKLEGLLSTEDRIFDGIYRPDVDDPQLCHPFGTAFWELQALATKHIDPGVRGAAQKLLNFDSAIS